MGFMIGSKLRYPALKNLGKAIGFVVIFEALGAFVLVTIGVYLVRGRMYEAILLGALSAATAPAGSNSYTSPGTAW